MIRWFLLGAGLALSALVIYAVSCTGGKVNPPNA